MKSVYGACFNKNLSKLGGVRLYLCTALNFCKFYSKTI